MIQNESIAKAGPFVAAGSAGEEFPFTFPVFDAAHIAVWVDEMEVVAGYTTTVSSGGLSGGHVVFNSGHLPASGAKVAIIRNVPHTQLTDLPDNGRFYPHVLEDMSDKAMMILQQHEEKLSRCAALPPTDTEMLDAITVVKRYASSSYNEAQRASGHADTASTYKVSAYDEAQRASGYADAASSATLTLISRGGHTVSSRNTYAGGITVSNVLSATSLAAASASAAKLTAGSATISSGNVTGKLSVASSGGVVISGEIAATQPWVEAQLIAKKFFAAPGSNPTVIYTSSPGSQTTPVTYYGSSWIRILDPDESGIHADVVHYSNWVISNSYFYGAYLMSSRGWADINMYGVSGGYTREFPHDSTAQSATFAVRGDAFVDKNGGQFPGFNLSVGGRIATSGNTYYTYMQGGYAGVTIQHEGPDFRNHLFQIGEGEYNRLCMQTDDADGGTLTGMQWSMKELTVGAFTTYVTLGVPHPFSAYLKFTSSGTIRAIGSSPLAGDYDFELAGGTGGTGGSYLPVSGNWTALTSPGTNGSQAQLTFSGGGLTYSGWASAGAGTAIRARDAGITISCQNSNAGCFTSGNLLAGSSAFVYNETATGHNAWLSLQGGDHARLIKHNGDATTIIAASNSLAELTYLSGGVTASVKAARAGVSGTYSSGTTSHVVTLNGSGLLLDGAAIGAAPSGAIIENQPFSTTVGGYTIEHTSNGGVSIYGSGASVTLSGGRVAVSAAQSVEAQYYNEDFADSAHVSIGYGGFAVTHGGMNGSAALYLSDNGVTVEGDISGFGSLVVDGSAITQVTSEFSGTSLGIAELAGGVKYICQSALTALSIGSAVAGCNGAIIFTVANGAIVTPPANVDYFGVTSYTPGSKYIMMVNDFAAVCNEAVVPGV